MHYFWYREAVFNAGTERDASATDSRCSVRIAPQHELGPEYPIAKEAGQIVLCALGVQQAIECTENEGVHLLWPMGRMHHQCFQQ